MDQEGDEGQAARAQQCDDQGGVAPVEPLPLGHAGHQCAETGDAKQGAEPVELLEALQLERVLR